MIHLFCALHCEAKPLIQHFKLAELKQFDLFRLYQSQDKQISLTIMGIGKLNAAAAISYQHACLHTTAADSWLNIGVAGHHSFTIGDAYLIHKITEQQSNTHWYPQIVFKPILDSAELITIDSPSTDYQDALFDMEAAGFYQMAIRLGTAELIHFIKIVSDNAKQDASTVNAQQVTELITDHIDNIEQLLISLKTLANEITTQISAPPEYPAFIERWHFTQSERIKLARILRHWHLYFPEQAAIQSAAKLNSGKQVLTTLENSLNKAEFNFND